MLTTISAYFRFMPVLTFDSIYAKCLLSIYASGYWHKSKEDLKATITQKGPPTIFFTLSYAEYHWPEFQNLFNDTKAEKMTPADRQKQVLRNPHILDWMFTERTDCFVKFWLDYSLQSSWHWYRYEYAVQRGSIHCHVVAKFKK